MKVSLVMAVYNGEKYLIEQLDSIRKQTYPIDEVLLLDDVSTDNSYELIHQYIDGYKLINWKLIKNEKNLGYRKNFKKGLEMVTGDIIFLCDQDDRWHLNKVETMVEYMKDEAILSLASSFNFMNQEGKCFEVNKIKGRSNNNLLFKEVTELLTEIDLNNLLEMNFSQGCTMAIKEEVKDNYLKVTQGKLPHDWELNIISSIKNGCYYLDKPLIDYRIHNNNTIGMDDIVEGNIINEKKKRVNKRIEQTKAQIENVNFALELELNREQKKYCLYYKEYLSQRVSMMEEKKPLSLILYFLKGEYKEFGRIKTFLGDLMNIIK
ncbi:glycosyltransferase [Faecalibacillus intestinalis]|uniref:glycosyltransferase n=1 Tax=Faecalibacillus intestinalis TaxID=1982626 RepID=UPI0022E61814|nr:glycosyltransferase [Faecalibacillus intestinalis]